MENKIELKKVIYVPLIKRNLLLYPTHLEEGHTGEHTATEYKMYRSGTREPYIHANSVERMLVVPFSEIITNKIELANARRRAGRRRRGAAAPDAAPLSDFLTRSQEAVRLAGPHVRP